MPEFVVVVGSDARPVELAHRRRIISAGVGGVHPQGSEVGLALPQGQSSSGPTYYTESGLTAQPAEITLAAVFRCTSFAGFNTIVGHQYGTDYGYSLWAQDAGIIFGRVPTAFSTPSINLTITSIQNVSHWYAVVVSSSAAYGANMTLRDLNNGAYLSASGSHQALASTTNRSGSIGYWGSVEDDGFNGYIKMGAMWRRAWTPGQMNAWVTDPLAFVRNARRRNISYRSPGGGATVYQKIVTGGLTPAAVIARTDGKVLSGSGTPSGVIARRAGKAPSGGATPAGVIARATGKTLAGSLTPSGTIARKASKSFTGAMTPSGVVATLKSLTRSLSGALTTAGAISRSAGKSLAGTLTDAGAISRATARTLTGSLTPTGTVATLKALSKSLTGALSFAGVVVRVPTKVLTGALTSAGSVVRPAGKSLVGALTPVGAIVRSLARPLAGGVTPSAVASAIKSLSQALSGALTPSGVEAGGAYANYYVYDTTIGANSTTSLGTADKGGSWTSTGTAAWGINSNGGYNTQTSGGSQSAYVDAGGVSQEVGLRHITDAIQTHVITVMPRYVNTSNFLQINTYAGAVKIVTKVAGVSNVRVTVAQGAAGNPLPATGASTADVMAQISNANLVQIYINGVAVPGASYQLTSGEITALATTTKVGVYNSWVSGTVTASRFTNFYAKRAIWMTAALTMAGALVKVRSLAFVGSLTPAATIAKGLARALAGSLTTAGAISRKTSRTLVGSLTSSGVVTELKSLSKLLSGALTSSGALARRGGKALVGSLTPSGAIRRAMARALAGSLTDTGSLKKGAGKALSGSLTPSGTVGSLKLLLRILTAVLTPVGALTRKAGKAVAGALTPAASMGKATGKPLAGTLAPSGVASALRVVTQFLSGALAPAGSISRASTKVVVGTMAATGALVRLVASGGRRLLALYRAIW